MRRVISLSLAMLIGSGLVATAVPAGAQEATNTVTVAASKKVDIEADLGLANFGVRTEDRSARTATNELSERVDSVLDALRAAGFTNDELATGSVRLERTCIRLCKDPDPRDEIPPRRIMGYVGSAGIGVETKRLDKLGAAVDAAVAGGASSIRNVSYEVEDDDAAVLQALREAMIFARAKAQVIAEEAGRTLGPALIVEEGRTTAPRSFDVAGDLDSAALGGSAGEAPSASIPFPIEPPTLSASARVTVTWELL